MLLQGMILNMNKIKVLKRYFIGEVVHKFLSCKLILAVIGVAFCICLDTWNQIPFLWNCERGDITGYYYFWNSYCYGGQYLPYFALSLSTVIGTVDYCNEHKSGVEVYVIQKIGNIRNYAYSKAFFTFASCVFIYLAGMILFLIFSSLFQPFYDAAMDSETQGFPYYNFLKYGNGILYFIILLYLALLRTTLWNMLSLLCSAYFKNKYITIAFPMLAAYAFRRFLAIIKIDSNLRLDMLLSGMTVFISDAITLCICSITVLLISLLCMKYFVKKVEKNVKNG